MSTEGMPAKLVRGLLVGLFMALKTLLSPKDHRKVFAPFSNARDN